MMVAFYLYTLADPVTPDNVRYVGWAMNPSERMVKHERDASRLVTHKARWIASLLALGRKPALDVIGAVQTREAAACIEKRLIASYRACGFDLTNATEGGDGVVGWTDEMRSSLRLRMLGKRRGPHSAETREKISASQRGRRLPARRKAQAIDALMRWRATATPAEKAAASAAQSAARIGKPRSPESVAKYTATLRTPEVRALISAKMKKLWAEGRGGVSSPESRAKLAQRKREQWASGIYADRLAARNADGTWAKMR
jgi:hypothetical protein